MLFLKEDAKWAHIWDGGDKFEVFLLRSVNITTNGSRLVDK